MRHRRRRHAHLTNSPPFRVLTVLSFADVFLAADVVARVLEFGPIGLEGLTGCWSISCAQKPRYGRRVAASARGGFLLVEMGAWDAAEAHAKAKALAHAAQAGQRRRRRAFIRRRRSGRVACAESALGATAFFRANLSDLRAGTMPAFLPRGWAITCASSRSHGRVRLSQPALRTLWPGLCPPEDQLDFRTVEACAASASSSTAQRIWFSAWAGRSARARRRPGSRGAAAQNVRP